MTVIDKLKSDPPSALILEEILLRWDAPPDTAKEAGELFALMSAPIEGKEIHPDSLMAALGFIASYTLDNVRDKEGTASALRTFGVLQDVLGRSMEQ